MLLSDFNLETLSLFVVFLPWGRLFGLMQMLSLEVMRRWSVQLSASLNIHFVYFLIPSVHH